MARIGACVCVTALRSLLLDQHANQEPDHMHHDTPLIATIVAGLALAFVCGAIAHRLRISPLVGYLVAGIAIGPYTPGFVGDQALANELAEIGVILLMFGVGLHFSLKELWSVRAIAIPGAVAQIGLATLLRPRPRTRARMVGRAGIVFGLALSVASTGRAAPSAAGAAARQHRARAYRRRLARRRRHRHGADAGAAAGPRSPFLGGNTSGPRARMAPRRRPARPGVSDIATGAGVHNREGRRASSP